MFKIERYEECQKATNNKDMENRNGINSRCESCLRRIGSLTMDDSCDKDCSILGKFHDCDEKGKNLNIEFTHGGQSYPHYTEVTRTNSEDSLGRVSNAHLYLEGSCHGSLKNASKSKPSPAIISICANKLFRIHHTNMEISKDVCSGENPSKSIDYTGRHDGSSCYFENEDLLVKDIDEETGGICPKSAQTKSVFVLSGNENGHSKVQCSSQPRHSSLKTYHSDSQTGNVSLQTGNSSSQTGNENGHSKVQCSPQPRHSSLKTYNSDSQTGNVSLQTGNSSSQTGNSSLQTGNSSLHNSNLSLQTGDPCLQTANSSLPTGYNRISSKPCKHSLSSNKKSSSEDGLCCRICHSVNDLEALVSPCLCTGSMKYVHESCLLNWLKSSVKTNCELCLHEVPVKKLLKPLRKVGFLCRYCGF